MEFTDCIKLKASVQSHEIWLNSKKFVLLVTPETEEYFREYILNPRKEDQDYVAINYAHDEKYILRWIAEDGTQHPFALGESL